MDDVLFVECGEKKEKKNDKKNDRKNDNMRIYGNGDVCGGELVGFLRDSYYLNDCDNGRC